MGVVRTYRDRFAHDGAYTKVHYKYQHKVVIMTKKVISIFGLSTANW